MTIKIYYNKEKHKYKYYWMGTRYGIRTNDDSIKKVMCAVNLVLNCRDYYCQEVVSIFNFDFESICKPEWWNVFDENLKSDSEFAGDYMWFVEHMNDRE